MTSQLSMADNSTRLSAPPSSFSLHDLATGSSNFTGSQWENATTMTFESATSNTTGSGTTTDGTGNARTNSTNFVGEMIQNTTDITIRLITGSTRYASTSEILFTSNNTTSGTDNIDVRTSGLSASSLFETTEEQTTYFSSLVSSITSSAPSGIEPTTFSTDVSLHLTGSEYYAAGVVVGALAVLFLISAFGLLMCRRRILSYHSLPSSTSSSCSSRNYDYLYRPLNKTNRTDEDYEHTFVGVSIPLLQEVTIV